MKNRSQHWLMKEAIERYLSEEEENERIKRETVERWELYIETGEAISHSIVETWLKPGVPIVNGHGCRKIAEMVACRGTRS